MSSVWLPLPSTSQVRPSISPNALSHSTSSLTPIRTNSSSSPSSTPQRSSSSSSQSSTASIPARPLRPPPIQTRTKASTGEQLGGSVGLKQGDVDTDVQSTGSLYAPLSPTHEEGEMNQVDLSTSPLSANRRKDNSGFVVHGGRRGSSNDVTSAAHSLVKRAVQEALTQGNHGPRRASPSTPSVGVTSFKFGEELGRGSFSVVRQATHLLTSTQYAIKVLDKHHLRIHKKEKYAQVEVEAFKRLSTSPPSIGYNGTATEASSRSNGSDKIGATGNNGLSKSTSQQTVTDVPIRQPSTNVLAERQIEVEKGRERASGGHPGVIKLFWAFQDMSSLYFVLDLAPNGELLSLIRKYGSLSTFSARQYAAELVDVVGWMHERGVLHRDLKPENILIDAEFHIRLTDFGSAKVLPLSKGKITPEQLAPPPPMTEPDTPRSFSSGRGPPRRSFVGTAEYVSPEVLLNEPASESSDFWAIGCIIFQCMAGQPPFRGKTEYLTFQKIKALDYEFPINFDEDAQDLIEKLLVLEPTQRLGTGPGRMQEIKTHPFFKSVQFSTLWTSPMPPISSGFVGPPPLSPARSEDFFAALDISHNDALKHSADEIEDGEKLGELSGLDDDDWDPPHSRWRRGPRNHAGSGSVSSGKSVVTLDPGSAAGFSFGGLGIGRPTSGYTDGSGSAGGVNGSNYTDGPEIGSGNMFKEEDNRGSAESGREGEAAARRTPLKGEDRARAISGPWISPTSKDKKGLPLLPDETPIFSSPVLVPASQPIAKTLSKPKERLLVLTDFPRLLCVKLDSKGTGILNVKYECLITRRGTGSGIGSGSGGGANVMKGVKEKGGRGFIIQTSHSSRIFLCSRVGDLNHFEKNRHKESNIASYLTFRCVTIISGGI
ncbi:protein kinase [Phaffia rhodozyma]|uniref:non-specific serine/threonine protein kinase n=1 Tax=Phaffia rhodozyma TaxID=264483 RepID=A0A0F7SIY6_PHARH|nr:protein kinase [Phaffia rhodozyma]